MHAKTKKWLAQAAENAFTDAVMAGSGVLQEELLSETLGRLPAGHRWVMQSIHANSRNWCRLAKMSSQMR